MTVKKINFFPNIDIPIYCFIAMNIYYFGPQKASISSWVPVGIILVKITHRAELVAGKGVINSLIKKMIFNFYVNFF